MMHSMLIVDDEEMVRWALRELFMHDGWEVHGAADGNEAVAMVQGNRYDFVITDLKLPGRSGVDVVREARRNNPDAGVMVLTGYGSLDTAVQALRLGAWDYVTKPCDVAYVRRRVGEFLQRVPAQNGELRNASLGDDDVVDFLGGSGTEVLSPVAMDVGEGDPSPLDRLKQVLTDVGLSERRGGQVVQFCVEAVACLRGRPLGRAALLKGHLVIGVTGSSGADEESWRMLRRVWFGFELDVRVVESNGGCSVVLCEGIAHEGGQGLPRRGARAEDSREGARQAS